MFFLNLRHITAVLAVTGITFALAPQPAEAELVGLVKRVVSDVYGTPPGFDREEKLPRFPVVQDELLETGKDSAMLVEFLDNTTLTLGAESRLTIDTMVYDPKSHDGTLVSNLSVGVLRFISGKMVNAGVRIVTPTANIGIRGSDALIVVLPDGSTTVNVFSGEFLVSDSGEDNQATVGPSRAVSVSAVGAVGAAYPDIDLRLSASLRHVDLHREDVDVAVRHGEDQWPDLHAVCLMAETLFPVCSPSLMEGPHPLDRPENLAHHTLIHLDNRQDWRKWLNAAGVDEPDMSKGAVFNQTSLALDAAAGGQGVALGRSALAAPDLLSGRLVRPFGPSLPVNYAYYIVCPKPTAEQPKICAFRDWIISEAKADEDGMKALGIFAPPDVGQ